MREYRHLPFLMLVGLLSVASPAYADAPEIPAEADQPEGALARWWADMSFRDAEVAPGERTTNLFALQLSGEQASANAQAASAVQREKAAERFLKTYEYAIKESYYGTSFKSGGGK